MQVTADYKGPSTWEENDPSVFNMTIVSTMHGEYQITNGYGLDKAAKFMRVRVDQFFVLLLAIYQENNSYDLYILSRIIGKVTSLRRISNSCHRMVSML